MRTALGTLFVLLTAAWALAAPSSAERLYVTNSEGDDITVIDLATLKVVGDITVGAHVHGVAIQGDGRRLFASIESSHTLKIVDTLTGKVTSTIALTGRPNECAVTPDGKFVGVPIRDGNSVDIVDVAQQKVAKVLPVKVPHNCFNAGSDQTMFVSSMGSNQIDAINLQTMEYSARIPVGGVPRPYVVAPDGRRMYVAVSGLLGFVIADVPNRRVIRRVEVSSVNHTPHPHPFEPIDTLTHGLALSPDGREVWLTNLLDDSIAVYDLAAQKTVASIPVGVAPNWMVFSPDGKYCCVSNAGSDDCSILSVKTRKEVARIKVGRTPKRVAAAYVPAN